MVSAQEGDYESQCGSSVTNDGYYRFSRKHYPINLKNPESGNDQDGKSAINLSNLGNFAEFGPRPFIYVRPVGGPENFLC